MSKIQEVELLPLRYLYSNQLVSPKHAVFRWVVKWGPLIANLGPGISCSNWETSGRISARIGQFRWRQDQFMDNDLVEAACRDLT